MQEKQHTVTLRSLVVGTIFAVIFALVTVYFENRHRLVLTATQIPTLPFFLLFVMVLVINPVCRFLRVMRRFTVAEVLVVFIMGSVSAGISTFGLASQLVPVVSSLFNHHWNNDQSAWNLHVQPFVNEAYFISEPGTRELSIIYRDAVEKQRRLQQAFSRANKLESLRAEERRLQERLRQRPDAPRIQGDLERVGQEISNADTAWQELRAMAPETPENTAIVVQGHPALIASQSREVEKARENLAKLEHKAFAKVEVLRRGLPENMRAFPGFLPMLDEDASSYLGRLRRLSGGLKAYGLLEAADGILEPLESTAAPDAAAVGKVAENIRQAVAALKPLADKTALEIKRQDRENIIAGLKEKRLAALNDLEKNRTLRRTADISEFPKLEKQIARLEDEARDLAEKIERQQSYNSSLLNQMQIADRVGVIDTKLETAAAALGNAGSPAPDLPQIRDTLGECMLQFRGFDASWRRFFIGDVPWRIWLKPVSLWFAIMGLTYIVLMSFNVLIFRQWAHNERLIYPLAELPQILAGNTVEDKTGVASMIPATFRSGLFWIGFSISALFLGWNLVAMSGQVPGITPMNLNNAWGPYITGSALQGLMPGAKSAIFFTLIGLTFLIPANISFSLWFFQLFYFAQLLILVWSGYGVNENSFPREWWYTFNFRTAQGGGAMLIFSSVVLFKCRKYLLCFFTPKNVADLEAPERTELRVSSFLFIFASAGLILMLWLGMGANLFYTLLVYFVVIVITIGLIRAVTEGGLLGFQSWISPFHFIRTLFGMNKEWTSPTLFAPLMIYYSVIFLDLKTFIAPAMANCIKIRDDLKMERFRFHLAVALAIVLAMVAAVACHIMLAYSQGADSMNSWFYSSFPQDLFGRISSMIKTLPVDSTGCSGWVGAGAVLMVALLWFRRIFFWVPHPIGLIMLVNPLMAAYWFSILLGWLAKSLVTKYGNKDTYTHVRKFFIGLIVGELVIIMLALVVSQWLQVEIKIDLNR